MDLVSEFINKIRFFSEIGDWRGLGGVDDTVAEVDHVAAGGKAQGDEFDAPAFAQLLIERSTQTRIGVSHLGTAQ
jgi:hypothetical protein